MRTLSGGQETERLKEGVQLLWLVKGTFDEFGLSTEYLRYGSNAITLSGNDYADGLAGVTLGSTKLKALGGLSSIASFGARIRDEDDISDLSDTHVISNDPVIVYLLFYTGGDAESDLIEVVRGVVERDSIRGYEWRWQCRDGSRKDLRYIPTKVLDPTTYAFAWTPGLPVPECFGNLNVAPYSAGGDVPSFAPCKFTNRWGLECTSSLNKKTGGDVYQWYEAASAFAFIVTTSESDDIITAVDPARVLSLRPSREKATNDVANYQRAMDEDTSTSTAIVNGDNLDLWLAGSPMLGQMTAIKVVVDATGDYTLTVKDGAVIKYGPTGETDDKTVTLTLSDYSENWDIVLLNVEIDGTADATITNVSLQIEFDDYLAFQDSEPRFFQSVTGFEDQTANYKDGAVITGAGTVLRNPVLQLEALLRAASLNDMAVADVDTTRFTAAAAHRAAWYLDWWFEPGQQFREEILDQLCFECGLYLWKKDGQWRVAVREKSRDPQHFFLAEYHSPVKGNRTTPPFEPDFELLPIDASEIYNEIAIRYRKHPATGAYRRNSIASGQYRISGTCTIVRATKTLTDGSATFVTNGVIAKDDDQTGEYLYVSGDTVYEVTTVTNETTLVIEAVDGGGVSDISSSTNYYLGPHINGQAFVSQQAYKTVNSLGSKQRSFLEEGGFTSEHVRDDDTADEMKQYFLDWFAVPRNRIKFPLFHVGAKLEEGDVFYYHNDRLFTSLKSIEVTTLNEAIDTSETAWTVDSVTVNFVREDDYLYVQSDLDGPPECVKVTTVNTTTAVLTVVRAQLGTEALAHNTSEELYRVTWKWMCNSLRPPIPSDPTWKVEAEQMPDDYFPVGRVVVNGYPGWAAATAVERVQSGWNTLRNGFIVDYDRNSNNSGVGPDSGTYVII